jgi:hypothetical protein
MDVVDLLNTLRRLHLIEAIQGGDEDMSIIIDVSSMRRRTKTTTSSTKGYVGRVLGWAAAT